MSDSIIVPPGAPHDFNASYLGTPPWDIGRPQKALQALADAGSLRGRVLDVGCGTGEHAMMAAKLGLSATGIDSAPRAIELATAKARQRGIRARFVVGDALQLELLGDQFETVLDCGLFHVLSDAQRERFVHSLSAVVPLDGLYFMLCFSDRQPGEGGPRRIRQEEIRASFRDGWEVESIEPAIIETAFGMEMQAWLARLKRSQGGTASTGVK